MNRRNRTVGVLVLALVMASAASVGVYRAVKKIPVQQVEVANYKVVVAAKAMSMGTRLAADDIKLVSWPASSPVANAHSDVKEVIDRGLLSAVVENEPIIDSKLAESAAGAGLSPTIPQGMRAISVKVNEVVGVAGFVVPGTRVDVLVTVRAQQDSATQTVVRNVQVLTAGTRYDQEKAKDGKPIPSTVVTLVVTPSDAERVALAQSHGVIMLALRNPLDTDSADTAGVRTATLFAAPPRPPSPSRPVAGVRRPVAPVRQAEPAPEPVKPYTVEAIKAAKRTMEEVKGVVR